MRVDRSTRKERVRELMEEYIEAGQPVEAAWVAYCYRYAPEGMPKDQFDDMRETFFAGATFVFSTITENARQSKGMPTPGPDWSTCRKSAGNCGPMSTRCCRPWAMPEDAKTPGGGLGDEPGVSHTQHTNEATPV